MTIKEFIEKYIGKPLNEYPAIVSLDFLIEAFQEATENFPNDYWAFRDELKKELEANNIIFVDDCRCEIDEGGLIELLTTNRI